MIKARALRHYRVGVGLLRDVVAGPKRVAHGRYQCEVLDQGNGVRLGTCHVFADGEIAPLDPDSDFSPIEPLDAISGISIERGLLSKKSTLRFDLNGMTITLKDTVSSDEIGRRMTNSRPDQRLRGDTGRKECDPRADWFTYT